VRILLHHFLVHATPSQSSQALLCPNSSFLRFDGCRRSLLVHAGSLETTRGRQGIGTTRYMKQCKHAVSRQIRFPKPVSSQEETEALFISACVLSRLADLPTRHLPSLPLPNTLPSPAQPHPLVSTCSSTSSNPLNPSPSHKVTHPPPLPTHPPSNFFLQTALPNPLPPQLQLGNRIHPPGPPPGQPATPDADPDHSPP
jgi:hypothetical protein